MLSRPLPGAYDRLPDLLVWLRAFERVGVFGPRPVTTPTGRILAMPDHIPPHDPEFPHAARRALRQLGLLRNVADEAAFRKAWEQVFLRPLP